MSSFNSIKPTSFSLFIHLFKPSISASVFLHNSSGEYGFNSPTIILREEMIDMPVYKDKVPAKSGKCWYFITRYKRLDGFHAQYHKKRYMTKREAHEAEAEFLIKPQNEASVSAITFNQLIDLFIKNSSTRVKDTTMYGYKTKRPYLDTIANVKLKDFNIDVHER